MLAICILRPAQPRWLRILVAFALCFALVAGVGRWSKMTGSLPAGSQAKVENGEETEKD